eukprot:207271_1
MLKFVSLLVHFIVLLNSQELSPCIPEVIRSGTTQSNAARSCVASIIINPSTTTSISETVEILYFNRTDDLLDQHHSTGLFYTIKFTPQGADCVSPTFSFSHFEIDNIDADDEYMIVFLNPETPIDCATNNTCSLRECFSEKAIPDLTVIPMGTSYSVMVITGEDIELKGNCDGKLEDWQVVVSASLTISCGIAPAATTIAPARTECECDCENGKNGDDDDDDDDNSSDELYNANVGNDNELND